MIKDKRFLLIIFLALFLVPASMISVANAQEDVYTITEKQITDSGKAIWPAICGDIIAYFVPKDNGYYGDVYVYDLSTSQETKIATGSTGMVNLDIDGGRIVWNYDSNGGCDIFMYDMASAKTVQITNDGQSYHPRIHGDKIVYQNGLSSPVIYVYDISISQKAQISASGPKFYPDIYGNKVVWTQNDGQEDNYILIYDLSTHQETKITSAMVATTATIYGDKVVWCDLTNGIHSYDIPTSKDTYLLTTNYSVLPAIYGDRIVWFDHPGPEENENVFIYNISTTKTTQITTDGKPRGPVSYTDKIVWGDRIVWWEYNNVIGSTDIYMATVTATVPESTNTPPTVNPLTITNIESATPTINWTYADAENDPQMQYELEVWSGQGGTGTKIWSQSQSSMYSSVTYSGNALMADKLYYVRVRAFDGTDWSEWSEVSFLSNPSNAIPTVTSVTVTNLESATPTISWTYTDAENNPQLKFEYEVWSGPGGTGTEMGIQLWDLSNNYVNYEGNTLEKGKTYFVRVKAYDGNGWSEWSETSFVSNAEPGQTANAPPSANPVTITNTESFIPTISWEYSDPNGDLQQQYQVEVWTGIGGTGTNMWIFTQDSAEKSVTYGGSPLSAGETYFVRVKVSDGKSWSSWSEAGFMSYKNLVSGVREQISLMKKNDPRQYFDLKKDAEFMKLATAEEKDLYDKYTYEIEFYRGMQSKMLDKALYYAQQGDAARVSKYLQAAQYNAGNAQTAFTNALSLYDHVLEKAILVVKTVQQANQLVAGAYFGPAADIVFAASDYAVNKNLNPEEAKTDLYVDAFFIAFANVKLPGLEGQTANDYIVQELASGKSQKEVYSALDAALANPESELLITAQIPNALEEVGAGIAWDGNKALVKDLIKETRSGLSLGSK